MKKNCCQTKQAKNKLQKAVDFLQVIAEENRLRILCILLKKQEMCVCEIWQELALPQNLASHHLKVLKDFQLVLSRREGTKIIYFVNGVEIKKYKRLLTHYL